jgi:hypothetical protein
MELEALRTLFHQQAAHSIRRPVPALMSLLRKNAATHITKLKRNIIFEFILAALFTIFPLYILVSYHGLHFLLLSVFLLVTCIAFMIYTARLFFMAKETELFNLSLRQALTRMIGFLKRYMQMYFITTMLFIPLFFFAGFLVMYMENQNKDPLLFYIDWKTSLLLYCAVFISWMGAMYVFTRWYVNKLYGKHVNALSKILTELEEQ